MKEWTIIDRSVTLEADIPLHSDAPNDVVSRYNLKETNKLIAWVNSDGSQFGLIKNNRSVTVNSSAAKSICLFEERPAKCLGGVGLSIKTNGSEKEFVLLSSRWSKDSIDWLKEVQPQLAVIFNLPQEYEDLGFCC